MEESAKFLRRAQTRVLEFHSLPSCNFYGSRSASFINAFFAFFSCENLSVSNLFPILLFVVTTAISMQISHRNFRMQITSFTTQGKDKFSKFIFIEFLSHLLFYFALKDLRFGINYFSTKLFKTKSDFSAN